MKIIQKTVKTKSIMTRWNTAMNLMIKKSGIIKLSWLKKNCLKGQLVA